MQFFRVKLAYKERTTPAFGDLYLVLLSPKGMHLIKHDLVTGVSTRGKFTATSGHRIAVCGSAGTDCWEDALVDMLEKLRKKGGCTVVHTQPFGKLDLKGILSAQASPSQAAIAL